MNPLSSPNHSAMGLRRSSLQQKCLSPSLPDLSSRRCISDSVLSRARNQSHTYNNKNTMFMMVSRSGGSTVKSMLVAINKACDTGGPSPIQEFSIIAQWAADSYYRVVITTNNGFSTIVRAMKTFPQDRGLQECCCLTLSNLCLSGNLEKAEQAGSVSAVIQAMKNHSSSVAVQSAACDALRNMSGLLEKQACAQELLDVLSQAQKLKLYSKHRVTANELYSMITAAPANKPER